MALRRGLVWWEEAIVSGTGFAPSTGVGFQVHIIYVFKKEKRLNYKAFTQSATETVTRFITQRIIQRRYQIAKSGAQNTNERR
jgi:hypothetical protein